MIDAEGQVVMSRQERIEKATHFFIHAFDRVMKMLSVEEDLDQAANNLIELGVQTFHVIMPLRSFREPVQLEGEFQEKVLSRQDLMKIVGTGGPRFDEELTRAVILDGRVCVPLPHRSLEPEGFRAVRL